MNAKAVRARAEHSGWHGRRGSKTGKNVESIGRMKANLRWRGIVGQIGILGWIIVTPTLIGLFIGRWLDHRFGTGIFWSAPLLLLGVAVGYWSAWRWMHKQ